MPDLFRVSGRLFMAGLQVSGYTAVFGVQVIWFVLHQRRDRIGEAFGWYGKAVIDAFAAALKG